MKHSIFSVLWSKFSKLNPQVLRPCHASRMNFAATYFDVFDSPAPPGLRSTTRMREDYWFATRASFTRYRTYETMMAFAAMARYLMRRILKIEAVNLHILLMWQLQTDADLRARVRDELGGETALDKWEARFVKVREAFTCRASELAGMGAKHDDQSADMPMAAPGAPETSPPAGRHPKCDPKTDSTGLYRLAPVPRLMKRRPQQEGQARQSFTRAPTPLYRFKPLPLHPLALRETDRDAEAEDVDTLLARSGVPGARLLWGLPSLDPPRERIPDPPASEWAYLGRDIFFC